MFFDDSQQPDSKDLKTQIEDDIETVSEKYKLQNDTFDSKEHTAKSRISITKLFMYWFFGLIAASVFLSPVINLGIAYVNEFYKLSCPMPYLKATKALSIIVSTLGSIFGFVIGFYFKNKEE